MKKSGLPRKSLKLNIFGPGRHLKQTIEKATVTPGKSAFECIHFAQPTTAWMLAKTHAGHDLS